MASLVEEKHATECREETCEEARTLPWKLRFHYEDIRERMSTFIKSLTTKDTRAPTVACATLGLFVCFFPRRVFTRD